MYDQFVEPPKRFADRSNPEGAHNRVAINLLTTKITAPYRPARNVNSPFAMTQEPAAACAGLWGRPAAIITGLIL